MAGPIAPVVRRLSRCVLRNGTEAVPYILCKKSPDSEELRKRGIFDLVGAGLPDGPPMPAASGKPTALRWVGRRGRRPLRSSQRINI